MSCGLDDQLSLLTFVTTVIFVVAPAAKLLIVHVNVFPFDVVAERLSLKNVSSNAISDEFMGIPHDYPSKVYIENCEFSELILTEASDSFILNSTIKSLTLGSDTDANIIIGNNITTLTDNGNNNVIQNNIINGVPQESGNGEPGQCEGKISSLEGLKNALNSGNNHIVLSGDTDITLTEQLTIDGNITITGNGATFRRATTHRGTLLLLRNGAVLKDIIIDGASIADGTWDKVIDIMAVNNTTISNVTINNGNECIMVGGDNNLIENCKITNAQGNGIHLSGCYKSAIKDNVVKNTNLSNSYKNGKCCIYVCRQVEDCIIEGNYCEDGYIGIGNLDADIATQTVDNTRIKVLNNTIVNCRYCGIFAACASETELCATDCIISGNIIKGTADANDGISSNVLIGTTNNNPLIADYNLIFSNNTLIEADLNMKGCKNVTVANNIIKNGRMGTGEVEKIKIINNTIENDWGYGIYGTGEKTEILVSGNNIKSKFNAIVMTKTTKSQICNNIISNCDDSDSGYKGIHVGTGCIIKNNRLDLVVGTAIISNASAIISENMIIGKNSETQVTAISVSGGLSNMIVINNMCNENAKFSIATVTNGTVENNTVYTGLL